MMDYTNAIYSLAAVTSVLTFAVIFVIRQPTDLPVLKHHEESH